MAENNPTPQEKAAAEKAAAEKAAADKLAADKLAADKLAKDKKEYVDFAYLSHRMYDQKTGKYILKNLTEKAGKYFQKLEANMKKVQGKKAKVSKTVFCRSINQQVKLVEGYAIPGGLPEGLDSTEKKFLETFF